LARFWRAFGISGGGLNTPNPPLGTPLEDSSPYTTLTFVPPSHCDTPYVSRITNHTIYIYKTLEAARELCTVNDAGRNILRRPSNFLFALHQSYTVLLISPRPPPEVRIYHAFLGAREGPQRTAITMSTWTRTRSKAVLIVLFLRWGYRVRISNQETGCTDIFLDFSQSIRCDTFMVPKINPRPLPRPVTQRPAFNAVYS